MKVFEDVFEGLNKAEALERLNHVGKPPRGRPPKRNGVKTERREFKCRLCHTWIRKEDLENHITRFHELPMPASLISEMYLK